MNGSPDRLHVRGHAIELPPAARETLRAQLSSYTAHLRHASSQRLWQRTQARHPWLARLFVLSKRSPRLKAVRWSPREVSNLADQHAYFAARYPGTRILMQVGKNWMLAGPRPVGLPLGRTVQRPSLGPCTEWPLKALPLLRQHLKLRGIAHQVVSQTGHFKTGFKQRTLTAVWFSASTTTTSTTATAQRPSFLFTPPPLKA